MYSSVFIFLQVNNTDAEGRLTLADALVYACNQGVDKVMTFMVSCSVHMITNLIFFNALMISL